MRPILLFYDPCTPRPYHPGKLDGCGGTEHTVIDLAEGLSKTNLFEVVVFQHNRMAGEDFKAGALYTGELPRSITYGVVLRDPRPLMGLRKKNPNSKLYTWSHDLADRNLGACYSANFFRDSGCAANVCVSQWHKHQTIETLKPLGYHGEFKTTYIYNPLGEDVVRTGEPYDKNKLVWLASPHKGLARAYEVFKQLVRLNSDFRLYVTNPGYMESQYTDDKEIKDRTVVLGTIPHLEAMAQLRTSLCLFYPNTVFPETFGKIMAEANAVGTPVITSPIGASREVLDSHPTQIVDCRDTEKVVKTVMKWWGGERPFVRGRPEFTLSRVISKWIELLKK